MEDILLQHWPIIALWIVALVATMVVATGASNDPSRVRRPPAPTTTIDLSRWTDHCARGRLPEGWSRSPAAKYDTTRFAEALRRIRR
jgi:hypothetical protein